MTYKLLAGGGVRRIEDGATIPPTNDNLDWQAYQAWLLVPGNVPAPADPLPGPDTAVGMTERARDQAHDDLDAAIAALPAAQQPAFRLIQQLLKE